MEILKKTQYEEVEIKFNGLVRDVDYAVENAISALVYKLIYSNLAEFTLKDLDSKLIKKANKWLKECGSNPFEGTSQKIKNLDPSDVVTLEEVLIVPGIDDFVNNENWRVGMFPVRPTKIITEELHIHNPLRLKDKPIIVTKLDGKWFNSGDMCDGLVFLLPEWAVGEGSANLEQTFNLLEPVV